jgi:hypothetical protein
VFVCVPCGCLSDKHAADKHVFAAAACFGARTGGLTAFVSEFLCVCWRVCVCERDSRTLLCMHVSGEVKVQVSAFSEVQARSLIQSASVPFTHPKLF